MNIFKKALEMLKRLIEYISGSDTTTTTTATTEGGWPTNCGCDLSKPLVEPDKGTECPVPWGLDVRFLGWSNKKRDWVFIGLNDGSVSKEGNNITGHCFVKNGKRYHYKGYRRPSINSEFMAEKTGTYKTTYRLFYDAREA